jgi:hypothetical protein
MATKEYDPELVDTIVGVAEMSGFAEDAMIKFEESEDQWVLKKGVDGTFTRVRIQGKAGIFTISLMSSSRSNDVLSALYLLDQLTPGGAGIVPLLVRDRNGTSTLAATESWIIKAPDLSFGKETETREWRLQVVDYKLYVGGM